MKGYTNDELHKMLDALEKQLTGDLMEDMKIQDRILELKRELGTAAPACNLDADDCESCSG